MIFRAVSLVAASAAFGFFVVSHSLGRSTGSGPHPAERAMPREAAVLVVLGGVNPIREAAGLAPLRVHPGVQVALDDFVTARGGGSEVEIRATFGFLQERLPRFSEWSGFLASGEDETELLTRIQDWPDAGQGTHTHVAVHVFDRPDGAVGCLAVLGREVPRLRLPMRCHEAPQFYDECTRCGHGQILAGWQGASALTCTKCGVAYDLLGADSDGRWRRATEFVAVPGPLPDQPPGGLVEVTEIWKQVAGRYRYRLDAELHGGGDSWSLPEETLRQGWGDCDDTAILLAHLLLARGHEARVVLGRMRGEGHAWVVVRVRGEGYLLETTLSETGRDEVPPRIEDVALDYDPEWQFDAERLYFKRVDNWTGRYWDEGMWWQVEDPERA